VGAVHVRVGHDDDAVAQLVGAKSSRRFAAVLAALPMPVPRAVIRVTISWLDSSFVAGLLHVQDLAAQRQDGLELAVAALLGGAAGGVTLDDVDLAQRGSFSWQSASLPGRPMPSSTPLRRVISRALRAASRARPRRSCRR
jgi:hypothetical protein